MPYNQPINGATVILAELEIKNNPDLPVVDVNRVRGGTHAVSTLTERDNLPSTLRKANITRCYVAQTDKFYLLKNGIANTNWIEDNSGAGGPTTVLGGLAKDNLNQTALSTTTDGQLACNTGLLATPQGAVIVAVGGKIVRTGDALKTLDCYFSRDNGLTALAIDSLAIGDKLYWNGSVAGYQLGSGDNAKLSFIYVKAVGTPTQGSNEVVITQSTPLAVWPITHNQSYAYPDVIVLDDNNQTLDCIYEYVDATHLNIIFDEPMTGKAILH